MNTKKLIAGHGVPVEPKLLLGKGGVDAPASLVRIAREFCLGLLVATFIFHPWAVAGDAVPSSTLNHLTVAKEASVVPSTRPQSGVVSTKRAHFASVRPPLKVQQMADWVVNSGDNHSLPFVIVDKTAAKVFVFHAEGRLRGTAAALLGLAVGDEAIPGIGDRPLANIRPAERTTPAGRFVAALDHNLRGKEILWVDYAGAISMHPVATNKPKERRLQRLATATPLDNRISYGCINVPAKFFKDVVRPAFTGTDGIVYVLPEVKSVGDIFEMYTEASKVNGKKESLPR